MNPTQKSPERAFALQKYLLLHSQHDALQKHLNQVSAKIPTTKFPSTSSTRIHHSSLSSSPESDNGFPVSSAPHVIRNHYHSGSIPAGLRPQRPAMATRRSSLPTVIDESIIGEIEEDEMKLKDVNLQIKSTLTELLNCESVRGSRQWRTWVQTRLMDAERELKVERTRSCKRRRSEDVDGMMI
ncbi:hypothetical protein BDZ45DRAFT_594249 [Acephala macrosclerotiorum]|nr:hypothetical protein BDZ45DRAFT_594249 [Acephala macrosclerotiorum]